METWATCAIKVPIGFANRHGFSFEKYEADSTNPVSLIEMRMKIKNP